MGGPATDEDIAEIRRLSGLAREIGILGISCRRSMAAVDALGRILPILIAAWTPQRRDSFREQEMPNSPPHECLRLSWEFYLGKFESFPRDSRHVTTLRPSRQSQFCFWFRWASSTKGGMAETFSLS